MSIRLALLIGDGDSWDDFSQLHTAFQRVAFVYFPQRAQDIVDASERYYHGTRNHGPEGGPSTVWAPRGETTSPANQTQISRNTCRVPDFFFRRGLCYMCFRSEAPVVLRRL